MISAVPASLQCVVADSGKLQSPDTHDDAARVTRDPSANSFMYRQKQTLLTKTEDFPVCPLCQPPEAMVFVSLVTWPLSQTSNINTLHSHSLTLLQIAGLLSVFYWFQSVEKLLSVYYRRVTGPASAVPGPVFPALSRPQSAVSSVSPGLARAHVFNEYKASVRMRGGGRVWAVSSIRVCSELTAKFTHQL